MSFLVPFNITTVVESFEFVDMYTYSSTVLQARRLRVRFPMVSLEFFIDRALPAAV